MDDTLYNAYSQLGISIKINAMLILMFRVRFVYVMVIYIRL